MQPISSRLITSILAGTEESGGDSTAGFTDLPQLTYSDSETRDSSGIAKCVMPSAEIPAKPDAFIKMNPDDFRQKLNSGTLPYGRIFVKGNLILTNFDVLASLPAGFTVGGDLRLVGCRLLTSLPEGLTVGRNLDLRDSTLLTSLPEGLNVRGWLFLSGCASLTLLPIGLTLGGDLNLEGCISLTSLPAGLTVGGSLLLSGCTSLSSLSAGLTVCGDLNLCGCTSLASLPEGLTVGGDLNLEGCTLLTSLPAGLTVGGDWDLSYCTSLTSLSEGLTVRGWLFLSGCTSLRLLPTGLTVNGDLGLSGCTSLTSLPAGLTVGGDLNLEGCMSLTWLPNGFTALGPLEDGSVREVILVGTGLSDTLINCLSRVEAPGMHFLFSRQAAAVEDAFTSIDEVISFWKALVDDAPLISLSLEAGEERNLISFLTRQKVTAEYKTTLARPVLAKRICNVLKKMEDREFKQIASLIIHEGLSTCHDRIISALDELDLMLQVEEAEEGGKREKLRALGRGMLKLEEVQKAAISHARTLTWVDEIEIQLAFQIGLRDRLQLPLSTGHMIFRGCAHVSDERIQQVGAEIERRISDKVVDDYLLNWAPWQKLLRREEFDVLEPELQETPTELRFECCISFDELTEGYLYGGNLYARDSLRRVYVEKGVDPFTQKVIDLTQVKKVVKSS